MIPTLDNGKPLKMYKNNIVLKIIELNKKHGDDFITYRTVVAGGRLKTFIISIDGEKYTTATFYQTYARMKIQTLYEEMINNGEEVL